jgi:lysophospholipid acyltransferase (LPLAT)-like uncharacterized protein
MKNFTLQRNFQLIFFLISLILISGCANNEVVDQCLKGHTYGFIGGLWHGFIAPFDFIGMLFNNKITMYSQNNDGGLYALGFLLGSGGWGFFGGKGIRRIQHTRVNIQNEKFDKAEIVE